MTNNRQSIKKATISDVAKLAKTGKTSVSRYLNGEFGILSATLKERIEQAIKELNYRPNQMARSLKKGQTKLIALILADITNPYSVEVMKGLEAACQDNGYTLLVCNINKEKAKEKYFLQLLMDYNVDGVIIHALRTQDSILRDLPFPVVLVDRRMSDLGYDIVGLDNIQATTLASNYLIDSGFEAIIFITESLTGVGTRQERVNTFKKIVKQQKGIVGEVVEIEDMNQQTELLDQHIVSFCQKCRGMRKAIVTVNGSVTLHVSLALKRLNIIWGKDIGLLSFDDPVWASVAGVGITTLRQPTYKIGYSSFEMLHRRMQGDHSEAKEYLYPGELIIRDSTN
ncbi:LacI family DNA-binding transcriptional regulator [Zophobihabitans entericus]|uniref:LacI family DNA-binding transcriptional regulator n=1 Tax=Zophobihabitans entericus TaxID=1635327 RepID=A0A6G9IAZ1_9GAMM|nr:LacI family DNA-binding transcriptional regulator [Zophobihabitans entericus]QIQ20989.1 LacI family DNA-binding transcriptional regulator [Zophobihabitans entericus]